MIAHIRTHLSIRPFQCEFCKKSFNEKGNLKTHLRIHTGERPYHCNQCPKSFKAFGQLKDHKSSHTGLKPFQCPICLKFYRRKGILKHHMLIHTNSRESNKGAFACFYCFLNFENPDELNMHFISHYGLTDKNDLSDEMTTQVSSSVCTGDSKQNEDEFNEKKNYYEDMFNMLQKDLCKNLQNNSENFLNLYHFNEFVEIDKLAFDFNYNDIGCCC